MNDAKSPYSLGKLMKWKHDAPINLQEDGQFQVPTR